MTWEIEFTVSAEREFSKLTRDIQKSIYEYLTKNVKHAPRTHGKQLKNSGAVKLWRYRFRDYRLICQIKDQEIKVLVIRIGKRDSVYKDLS